MDDQRYRRRNGRLGDHQRAVEPDAALVLAAAAERVHGGHEGVGSRDDGVGEGRVGEVADVLLDAGRVGRGADTTYDGAHGGAALAECGHDVAAHESVGSGHDDDGRGHASTLSGLANGWFLRRWTRPRPGEGARGHHQNR